METELKRRTFAGWTAGPLTPEEASFVAKRADALVKAFNARGSKEIAECRKYGVSWDSCLKKVLSSKPSADGTAVLVDVETVIRENYWKGPAESYVRSSEITKRFIAGEDGSVLPGTEFVVRLVNDSRFGEPDEKRVRLGMVEHPLESSWGYFL